MDRNNDIKLVRMKNAANILFTDIKTHTFAAEMIILFGSVANNNINEYSDMDICIVSDEDLSIKQKRDIENYFYDTTQNEFELDFIYCDKNKLINGSQVFESIRKDGKVIYGRL
ncbi:MAG: nucleotidyltransferase domain-containing protein [Defluviitaleaceae bacterium]|nr:nucleotidyltransferase domain-containing protein [Defluviitaleaceae bacterium]